MAATATLRPGSGLLGGGLLGGEAFTPRTPRNRPLALGAEAVLRAPAGPVARAAARRVLGQPCNELLPPAGVRTGVHGPDRALETPRAPSDLLMMTIKPRRDGTVHEPPALAVGEREAALQLLREGGVHGGAAALGSGEPPEAALAEEAVPPPPPADDELLRCHRLFLGRARGRGASGLPRLAAALRAAATAPSPGLTLSPDGSALDCLDEPGFTRVATAEGLCLCAHECRQLFRYLAEPFGGQALPARALVDAVYGELPPERLRAVREVWESLDPEAEGCVEVDALLARFDPGRLPSVRFGSEDRHTMRRQLLAGLGVGEAAQGGRLDVFAQEEAYSRRRPWPAGAASCGGAAGGPIQAPAGKPGVRSRARGDVPAELSARAPTHRGDEKVTVWDFVAFYTALSHGMTDGDEFERTVREPWNGQALREEYCAARRELRRMDRGDRRPKMRVLAVMEDDSQRILLIRDDRGLQELIGRAGVTNGQMWTWGSGVEREIIRRFQAEGVHGIRHVRLTPF